VGLEENVAISTRRRMDDFADATAGSNRENAARFTHSRILLVSFNAKVRSEIAIQGVLAFP
jgi:hypothetical protein